MEPEQSRLERLVTPHTDLASFTDHLSQAWGVAAGASAAQYVAWSESAGVIAQLATHTCVTVDDLCAETILSEEGVDSLLPILMALGIAERAPGGYRLTPLGTEYFLRESPYYVGPGLFWGCDKVMPARYLRCGESAEPGNSVALVLPESLMLLKIQQSRNLGPGICAARTGRFEGITHLVDIGGGAGSLAIPFALDHPEARVTLVDLPEKIKDIGDIVCQYGLQDQIELRAMDVFVDCWDFPNCDGILFGNIFHMFNDIKCRSLARQCFDSVGPKGKIFLHELLFDEGRGGPMIAALWNANMHFMGGRQRSAAELVAILGDSGFRDFDVTPTAGRFSLITAVKC
jgi:acetylserotonin N-methyltransferase